MYSTCLHCTKSLGTNQALETLPIGRRVAFDAAKGRLWAICPHCAKWNLVPFDTRLESIDACERLYRDTPTRYATDNIGLARTKEGLELVRIGAPLRPEFASWRYGDSFKRRRQRGMILASMGAVAGSAAVFAAQWLHPAVAVALGGLSYNAGSLGWNAAMRWQSRVAVRDPRDDARRTLHRRDLREARLLLTEDGTTLSVPRPRTDARIAMRWSGLDARAVARRLSGRLNLMDGTERRMKLAVGLLAERGGDLSGWFKETGDRHRAMDRRKVSSPVFASDAARFWDGLDEPAVVLGKLDGAERLAVEMWLSEDVERTWLESELKLLEREWREAERLGKIADDFLLTQETRDT